MTAITRRKAVKQFGLGSAFLMVGGCRWKNLWKKHKITLSFDDGLERSSIKTAEIYEKYKLSATINVLAKGFRVKDPTTPPLGDFDLWNDLQSGGHEIMPHGYNHSHLPQLPFEEACELINECLDTFSEKLDGFVAENAIFNFPYNDSTQELEDYLKTKVRAFRTSGPAVNPLPHPGQFRLTCISDGPGNIDKHLDKTIDEFLEGPPGWLIYNTHGLDGVAWGPMSSVFLDELLDRLTGLDSVEVLSITQALNQLP
ncbi:MAG: polysaccharide deacetylase family protein [Bacteroidota bacterium]